MFQQVAASDRCPGLSRDILRRFPQIRITPPQHHAPVDCEECAENVDPPFEYVHTGHVGGQGGKSRNRHLRRPVENETSPCVEMRRNLGCNPTRNVESCFKQARNVNGAFRLERRLCRRNSTRLSNTTGKSMFRLLNSACVIAVMGTVLDTTSQVSIAMPVVRLERNRDIAVWIVTNMTGTLNVSKTNCVTRSRLFLGSQRTFVSEAGCSSDATPSSGGNSVRHIVVRVLAMTVVPLRANRGSTAWIATNIARRRTSQTGPMSCALGGHESDGASVIVHHEARRASRSRQTRNSLDRNVHGGHSDRLVGRRRQWILMAPRLLPGAGDCKSL